MVCRYVIVLWSRLYLWTEGFKALLLTAQLSQKIIQNYSFAWDQLRNDDGWQMQKPNFSHTLLLLRQTNISQKACMETSKCAVLDWHNAKSTKFWNCWSKMVPFTFVWEKIRVQTWRKVNFRPESLPLTYTLA